MKWAALIVLACVAAGPATETELTSHPEAILTSVDPSKLTIYGVHVGDSYDKIPNDRIEGGPGSDATNLFLKGNVSVRHCGGKVVGLVVYDVSKLGVLDIYDLIFRLGTPDFADAHALVYRSRHLIVYANGTTPTAIEVR